MIDATNLSTVPFITEYYGIWACYEPVFRAAFERVSKMNIAVHLAKVRAAKAVAGEARGGLYQTQIGADGTAVVQIVGTLMKQESSATASTSTAMMRRSMRSLASNDAVERVMLIIDSPGGTVSGTQDLASDIAALAAVKPCMAYCEDLCASAAYWLASQTRSVSANNGLVGSIGTYSVVYDQSKAAEMQGVKTHVIRAGKFKGMGAPGTEVTSDQLTEMQRIVDSLNEDFVSAVARGRKMTTSKVHDIADGRVHPSAEAKRLGLIDNVESLDAAMNRLKEMKPGAMSPSGPIQNPTTPRKEKYVMAMTTKDIKSACPGASNDFIVDAMETCETIEQVKTSFIAFQSAQLRARDEETGSQRQTTRKPGVPAQAGSASTDDRAGGGESPLTRMKSLVNARFKELMSNAGPTGAGRAEELKARAWTQIKQENEALHDEILAESGTRQEKLNNLRWEMAKIENTR